MTDEERIAEFLATKGATQVAAAPAFGIDPIIDRQRRKDARTARLVETEQDHDARMEAAHDAFFTGDKDEGYRLLGERRVRLQRF